jgi:hypothetical protein
MPYTAVYLQVMPVGTGRGNPNVDPHENPYPLGGYGFLVGPGPGMANSTWRLPVQFTKRRYSRSPPKRR